MAGNTPTILSPKAQSGVIEFQKQCYNLLGSQWNVREQMRRVDLLYIRETDWTQENQKAKLSNRYGNANKIQNITIPIVLPAIESSVVYQSSVFLQGSPIFGVVANADQEDAAMQMEAIIEDQQTRGGWIRHLQMFFRDGFKYNMSALEVDWKEIATWDLVTDNTFQSGKVGKPKQIIWAGNTIKRLNMYNTIWDLRVPITEVSERGEFAGYVELMSRIELKGFVKSLPNVAVVNLEAAFATGLGGANINNSASGHYYIPPINQDAMINQNLRSGTNWMAWAGITGLNTTQQDKNYYEVTTLYARILPSDFGIRAADVDMPQIWKFIIVNQQVIIYAERQTNAHNRIPILFGSPLEDGLEYQTKSQATNVSPIQDATSALFNSVIAARRKAISDRMLYDPSRVGEAQINSDNPSAKIPVRPRAYGQPLNESVYAIPFNDQNSSDILHMLPNFSRMAQEITGQNPARQGQFVKGNKTQTEYSDVMNNSNGRDQNTSLLYEAQVFTPLKEIVKLNILQYQGPDEIYYASQEKQVTIDPVVLRNSVIKFKMTDGLTPASKQINSDVLQTAMQMIGTSPALAQGYNVAPLFSYIIKTQGGDIKGFEKSPQQIAFENAMNSWTQMAQLAISKGQQWNQPQPTPQQYGYLQPGQAPAPAPNALQSFMSTLSQQAAANPATAADSPAPQPTTVQ